MTKQAIKDLLYDVENEFDNELDYDFDYNGREITDDELDMISYAISCFVNKCSVMIDESEEQ